MFSLLPNIFPTECQWVSFVSVHFDIPLSLLFYQCSTLILNSSVTDDTQAMPHLTQEVKFAAHIEQREKLRKGHKIYIL